MEDCCKKHRVSTIFSKVSSPFRNTDRKLWIYVHKVYAVFRVSTWGKVCIDQKKIHQHDYQRTDVKWYQAATVWQADSSRTPSGDWPYHQVLGRRKLRLYKEEAIETKKTTGNYSRGRGVLVFSGTHAGASWVV